MNSDDEFIENSAPPQEEKKGNDSDIENAVNKPYDSIREYNNSDDNNFDPPCKSTLWSDERGNLKVVNLIVNNPCKIFWLIILLVIALSFILVVVVFRTAEDGNPFTLPRNEFDLNDKRSIQYDSLRLASDLVKESRDALGKEGMTTLKQSEMEAIQYWWVCCLSFCCWLDFAVWRQEAFMHSSLLFAHFHSLSLSLSLSLSPGSLKLQLQVVCLEMKQVFKG